MLSWKKAITDYKIVPFVSIELLRHSQINLALDTCTHVIPSLQYEVAEKMENFPLVLKVRVLHGSTLIYSSLSLLSPCLWR